MDEKMFELMTKMYSEMQEMNTRLTNEIQEMNIKLTEEIQEMNKKLDMKADKQDIALLEYSINEKLIALFDAREVSMGKETEMTTGLIRVENKVDKLGLRVLRQELTDKNLK